MSANIPDPLPDDSTYFQILIDSRVSAPHAVHLTFTANQMSLTSTDILNITWLTGGGPQFDDWRSPVMQIVDDLTGVSRGPEFRNTFDVTLDQLPFDPSGKYRVLKIPFRDPADPKNKSLSGSGHLTITLNAPAVMQINQAGSGFAFALPSPDPAGAGGDNHWDFVEFNCATPASNAKSVCFCNTTNVDFFSLGIAIKGRQSDGAMAEFGLDLSGVDPVSSLITALTGDGVPAEYQAGLVQKTGGFLRFLAPGLSFNAGACSLNTAIEDGFANYESQLLTFSVGNKRYEACTKNGALAFTKPKPFTIKQPTSKEVIASTGPLDTGSTSDPDIQAAMKYIDAALNRGVFTDTASWSTPANWYPTKVEHNVYSRILHERFLGGACYAFSYDDVPGAPVTSAPAIATCTSMTLVITDQ